jgi:nicotinate-nucleotide adenylyltransferase
LFGGAFDPPHAAHRALAQTAIESLQLDLLYVVPTGQAWHKSRTLTATAHRLAMTRLAFDGLTQAVIDPRELNHNGPSYTVDTLSALKAEHPGAQFFLIMGADQAGKFTTWHQWAQIAQWAELAIADRPLDTGPESGPTEWHNPPQTKALRLHMPLMPISATDIRLQLQTQKASDMALSPSVLAYIQQHHLYTEQHD